MRSTCRTCHGGGEVGDRQDYWGNWESKNCPACKGNGWGGDFAWPARDPADCPWCQLGSCSFVQEAMAA